MSVAVGNLAVRKMALLLLDNFNGIDYGAYEILTALLIETGNEDILEHVDVYEGGKRNCAYIGEDYAEEELQKIEKQKEYCVWKLDGQAYVTECGESDMAFREGYCDCGLKIVITDPVAE